MDQNNQKDQSNQTQTQATPKQQVTERIKSANNVLVTVKSNPSVDELAATIGLTLMLNKLGKHATAVFSGEVPSTLEFLKPEETIETNTDSLRDFIVSLDKSKADKLRYKVEENVVKIFITPYRTSITQDDLEFTQGDFNVDAVLALGVTQREELDQAITQHGRILHDATVVTITAGQDFSELGQINWQEQGASSLSEMLVSISEALQGGLIDEQIATAFLTGIVSETERFSNPKTTPKVMTMAAQLMAAGANQQLIANELEKVVEVDMAAPVEALDPEEPVATPPEEPGTLSIAHDEPAPEVTPAPEPLGESAPTEEKPEAPAEEPKSDELPSVSDILDVPKSVDGVDDEGNQIHIDVEGNMMRRAAAEPKHKIIQPLSRPEESEGIPPLSAALAPAQDESAESALPDITSPAPAAEEPVAAQATEESPAPEPLLPPVPAPTPEPAQAAPVEQAPTPSAFPPAPQLDLTPSAPIADSTTLQQLEAAVDSPHLEQSPSADDARSAVDAAFGQAPFDPAHNARSDVGTLPLGTPPEPSTYDSFRLPDAPAAPAAPVTDVSGNLPGDISAPPVSEPIVQSDGLAQQVPGGMPLHTLGEVIPENNQIAPPPVPPPMMPQ